MGNSFNSRILIVAASARPWIRSAEIAGFHVTAFDFFRDWDSVGVEGQQGSSSRGRLGVTRSRHVGRLERFEDLLNHKNLDLISNCDYAIFAGGVENHPAIIEALAPGVEILGAEGLQLARISDTLKLLTRLEELGYQVPESSSRLEDTADPKKWLKKSFRSSSGLGIRQASEEDVGLEDNSYYFQRKLPGESFSGIFISVPQNKPGVCAALVGWTRQLINEHWCGAGEFRYCGSIGPLSINKTLKTKIEAIGQVVAEEYGITGAWGIDFLVDGSEVWPVDFNIRLTASMELFDGANEDADVPFRSIIELHARACLGKLDMAQLQRSNDQFGFKSDYCLGKSIVFFAGVAPLQITEKVHRKLASQWVLIDDLRPGGFGLADIPNIGEWVKPGQPICTILAKELPHRVEGVLKRVAENLHRTLA